MTMFWECWCIKNNKSRPYSASETDDLGQICHIFFLALAALAGPRLGNISAGIRWFK